MVDFVSLFTGMSERDIGYLLKNMVQKTINSELTNTEISSIDNKTPVLITNAKDVELMSDISIQNAISIEPTTRYFATEEVDGKDTKLWLKFQNVGELRDWSYQKNKSFSTGGNTMPGLFSKFNENSMLKYEIYSYFNGNSHYAYTLDSPHVQIKPNITAGKITSFFMRFLPISLSRVLYSQNIALFTKVDDDQIRYGYSAILDALGSIHFYVRHDYRQYHLFVRDAYNYILTDPLYDSGANFELENFSKKNFLTGFEFLCGLVAAQLPFHDWFFKYNPTTKNMSVINTSQNNFASVLADTSFISSPPAISCPIQEGKWTHSGTVQTTVYDNSGNNRNGTISNIAVGGVWQADNTLLSLGSNDSGTGDGIEISFPTITAIDNATQYTISFWYKPDTNLNEKSYSVYLANKNWAANGSWIIYRSSGSSGLTLGYKDSGGTSYSVVYPNAFPQIDKWYNIVAKIIPNEPIKLYVNGNVAVGSGSLPANVTAPLGVIKLLRTTAAASGTIALFKFWTSDLTDSQIEEIVYEGYHNPLFPRSENIQPVAEENPTPIPIPFTNIYTLDKMATPVSGDYRRINSLANNASFIQRYSVADGTSFTNPEQINYDVAAGSGTPGSSDPFVLHYSYAATGGGGTTPFTRIVIVNSSDNSIGKVGDGQNDIVALEMTSTGSGAGAALNGKKVTRAIFWMRRPSSSVTGTIYCRIWNASTSTTPVATLGSIAASSITEGSSGSDWLPYTFTNTSNTVVMQSGYRIGIEYQGYGEGDVIDIQRYSSGDNDTSIVQGTYDGSWNTNSSFDIKGDFYEGGINTTYLPLSTNAGNRVAAIEVLAGSPVIGKVITKAHFSLKAENTPSGTVYCRVWDNLGTLVATINSMATTSINTAGFTEYVFQNPSITYAPIQANWRIGIEYAGGGATNDTVYVQTDKTDGVPNARRARRDTAGAWFWHDTEEVGGKLYSGTGTSVPSTDPWILLSPGTGNLDRAAQHIGSADSLIGKRLTKVKFRLKRVGTVSGTLRFELRDTNGTTTIVSFGTMSAASVSTTETDYEFTKLNNNVTTSVSSQFGVYWDTPGGTGNIQVLTNRGTTDDHNSTSSYARAFKVGTGWINYNSNPNLDLTGQVKSGGDSFSAFVRFTDDIVRIGTKAVNTASSLHNQKITKVVPRLKKVGSPTGLINCYIRDPNDNIRVTFSSVDVSTLTTAYADYEFMNVVHNYLINSAAGSGDKIVFEFANANATNYVEMNANSDVFNGLNTITQTFDGINYTDDAQHDLAGKMYSGGEPDMNSRTRVAQSIEHQSSRLKGKRITRVKAYLYRTTTATSGTVFCNIRGTNDVLVTTLATIPASSLSTTVGTPTFVTFQNTTNNYAMAVGDKISIEFNGGDGSNQVGVLVRSVTPNYDTTFSYIRKYNEIDYSDAETAVDLAGTMEEGGFTFTPDPNTIPDPTPINDKDLIYCAGNNKFSGFAEMFLMEFRIYTKDITLEQADSLYENRYSISQVGPGEILMPFSLKADSLTAPSP